MIIRFLRYQLQTSQAFLDFTVSNATGDSYYVAGPSPPGINLTTILDGISLRWYFTTYHADVVPIQQNFIQVCLGASIIAFDC